VSGDPPTRDEPVLRAPLLLDKIEALKKGFVSAQRAAEKKIRRQKRRRSRRAKQRMPPTRPTTPKGKRAASRGED